jgi:hypothetical protein
MRRPSVLALVLIAGCAATPLKPGAELVRVTHAEPTSGCKWLGDVTGSQGNSFTGQYTTNANLETGARNDLKNKAAALGGNLVVIITERVGRTPDFGIEDWGPIHRTDVTLTGSVYSCPSESLWQRDPNPYLGYNQRRTAAT